MYQPQLLLGDCLNIPLEDDSVDMSIGSPPYGNQRGYGIGMGFDSDEEWTSWCAHRFEEQIRITRGLVCWVVEGYTRKGTFHPLPELLTVELLRRGVNIRQRLIYHRAGIMGGSPDELARRHEIVICASKHAGRLPYAKPSATGHPPKFPPGGKPSHQSRDGRVNQPRPHQAVGGSERKAVRQYKPPATCKASDVISCGTVGGGHMGSRLSRENEAPFAEKLIKPLVLTWCPPDGLLFDGFAGSGATLAVAMKTGRRSIGMDIRQNQIDLCERRIAEVRNESV